MSAATENGSDSTISTLRATLTSESTSLALRFRALFSLKHLASLHPPTSQTVPAIEAVAAAFTSPSALLKHELAYCLGQTRNSAAVPHLQNVLKNKAEDAMCRHEAAEALGALGDRGSIELLKGLRDDSEEPVVVRETCEIAVDRIEWEHDQAKQQAEKVKKRYSFTRRWVVLGQANTG
jgi:deoxyhypusine monooxygenase